MAAFQFKASYGLMTDPQSLKQYEEAMPGMGKAIVQQFLNQTDREQTHRHKIEDQYAAAEIQSDSRLIAQGDRAQRIGGTIIVLVVFLAGYMVYKGDSTAAAAVLTAICGGTVGTYIYGRKKQADEVKAAAAQPQQPTAGTVDARSVDDTSG